MKCIYRTLVLFVAVCGAVSYAHAQTASRSTDTVTKSQQQSYLLKPKGPKAITNEMSGGIELNSNGGFLFRGANLFVNIAKVKPKDMKHSDMFYNTRLWQVEFSEVKDPKEYKTSGENGGSSNSYVYGKINNFYALKLGRFYMRMLAGKPDPGSVSIHWLYGGGFSLGLLKPYYLNVFSDPNAIKYGDDTKQDFLNQQLIESSAGFSKGLSEIKIIPGFHLKTGLHFDFSANRKSVIGVEAGVTGEYYTQPVPIMANESANSYFIGLYISAEFGKRW